MPHPASSIMCTELLIVLTQLLFVYLFVAHWNGGGGGGSTLLLANKTSKHKFFFITEAHTWLTLFVNKGYSAR